MPSGLSAAGSRAWRGQGAVVERQRRLDQPGQALAEHRGAEHRRLGVEQLLHDRVDPVAVALGIGPTLEDHAPASTARIAHGGEVGLPVGQCPHRLLERAQ